MTVRVAKATNPEQLGWRNRIARHEPQLARAFLEWVARLRDQITSPQILHAVASGSSTAFDHVVQAVTFAPNLAPAAIDEAVREFDRLTTAGGHTLRLSLDLRDPNFTTALERDRARLVREVSGETRRAIANMVGRGYQRGIPVQDVAREIHEAVGLTSRQAQAVLNFADAQRARGVRPDLAVDRTMRYAQRMRRRRALTIARTETARAAVRGRLASYEQAAARGLFDPATAMLEWASVQDDPTEVCATLDGERVPFETGTFEGLLPPVHPGCRCSVHLVL